MAQYNQFYIPGKIAITMNCITTFKHFCFCSIPPGGAFRMIGPPELMPRLILENVALPPNPPGQERDCEPEEVRQLVIKDKHSNYDD